MAHEPSLLRVTVDVGVEAAGELDAYTAPRLAEAVRALPPGERQVDATGVTFVGSSGLNLMLELHDECIRAGDHLSILASGAVRRLAAITGLDEVLPFV